MLFKGLCIGALGIPIGILTGLGSIGLVLSVVSKNFNQILYSNVPLSVTPSLPAIAAAAAVSLVTILISAAILAKRAANMPVMDCIRQTNEVKFEAGALKTSKLTDRLYRLEGKLTMKNFKRNKKQYRSIVLSLVLSIALFISSSAFLANLKQMSQQAKKVTSYDIGFGTQDMADDELLRLYAALKTTDASMKAPIRPWRTIPVPFGQPRFPKPAG